MDSTSSCEDQADSTDAIADSCWIISADTPSMAQSSAYISSRQLGFNWPPTMPPSSSSLFRFSSIIYKNTSISSFTPFHGASRFLSLLPIAEQMALRSTENVEENIFVWTSDDEIDDDCTAISLSSFSGDVPSISQTAAYVCSRQLGLNWPPTMPPAVKYLSQFQPNRGKNNLEISALAPTSLPLNHGSFSRFLSLLSNFRPMEFQPNIEDARSFSDEEIDGMNAERQYHRIVVAANRGQVLALIDHGIEHSRNVAQMLKKLVAAIDTKKTRESLKIVADHASSLSELFEDAVMVLTPRTVLNCAIYDSEEEDPSECKSISLVTETSKPKPQLHEEAPPSMKLDYLNRSFRAYFIGISLEITKLVQVARNLHASIPGIEDNFMENWLSALVADVVSLYKKYYFQEREAIKWLHTRGACDWIENIPWMASLELFFPGAHSLKRNPNWSKNEDEEFSASYSGVIGFIEEEFRAVQLGRALATIINVRFNVDSVVGFMEAVAMIVADKVKEEALKNTIEATLDFYKKFLYEQRLCHGRITGSLPPTTPASTRFDFAVIVGKRWNLETFLTAICFGIHKQLTAAAEALEDFADGRLFKSANKVLLHVDSIMEKMPVVVSSVCGITEDEAREKLQKCFYEFME